MDTTIKDFESAIAEADTIARALEEGDLPLEKSLELYERGELRASPASFEGEPGVSK